MILFVLVAMLCCFAVLFLMPLIVLLIIVGMLSGCATLAPTIAVQGPTVPDQLLTCKPEPVPPSGGTQRAVASHVLDQADAGDDCRQKLAAVRTIVRP